MAEEEGSAEGKAPDAGGAEEAPKKKLPLMLMGLALQLVVMLGAVGLLVKAVYFTKGPDLSEGKLRERAIASVRDDSQQIQTFDLKDFSVNLPGRHILKANIQLEVSDPQTVKAIEKRGAAIKSRILDVLGSQSLDKTSSFQGKLLLKDALREAINEEILSTGEKNGVVREVFFIEFVLI